SAASGKPACMLGDWLPSPPLPPPGKTIALGSAPAMAWPRFGSTIETDGRKRSSNASSRGRERFRRELLRKGWLEDLAVARKCLRRWERDMQTSVERDDRNRRLSTNRRIVLGWQLSTAVAFLDCESS